MREILLKKAVNTHIRITREDVNLTILKRRKVDQLVFIHRKVDKLDVEYFSALEPDEGRTLNVKDDDLRKILNGENVPLSLDYAGKINGIYGCMFIT